MKKNIKIMIVLLIIAVVIFSIFMLTKKETYKKLSNQAIYPTIKYGDKYTLVDLSKTNFLSSCLNTENVSYEFNMKNIENIIQESDSGNKACEYVWWSDNNSKWIKTLKKNWGSFWQLKKWDPVSNKFIESNGTDVLYGDTVKILYNGDGCNSKDSYISGERGGCNMVIRDEAISDYFTIKSPNGKEDKTVLRMEEPIVLLRNNKEKSLFGSLSTNITLITKDNKTIDRTGNYDVKTLETDLKNQKSWWLISR